VYWVVALGGIRRRSWVEEVVGFFRAGGVFLFIGFFFIFIFFFFIRSRSGVFMTIEFGVFK
jgi:hypothetical protein